MPLHSTPPTWEVVDSYSVDPVRVFLEDEGAVITRIASHEIVGEYTFDMAHPSPPTSPKASKKSSSESRTSHTSHKEAGTQLKQDGHLSQAKPAQPAQSNRPQQRRRASLPERGERKAKIDCFGHFSRRQPRSGRSFDWRLPLRRSSLPGPVSPLAPHIAPTTVKTASPVSPPNPTNLATPATAGTQQQHRFSQKLTNFSFLRLHRRLSDSGSSSTSSSASSASDGNVAEAATTNNNGGDANIPAQPKQEIVSSPTSLTPRKSTHRPSRDLSPTAKPHGYKKSDVKKSIVFARGELMKQVEKSGKNALLLEGWTVTVLKQDERYRIQVVYTGRPALVDFSSATIHKRQPPFLRVIDPEIL